MYRETDIVFENSTAWVLRKKDAYVVMKTGVTHSESDSAYPATADGLSIAKARAGYLEKSHVNQVLKDLWAGEMKLAARGEGWDLFTSFGSEDGPLQVWHIGDSQAQQRAEALALKLDVSCPVVPVLARDDLAMAVLASGTAPHRAVAMAILEKCNPPVAQQIHRRG